MPLALETNVESIVAQPARDRQPSDDAARERRRVRVTDGILIEFTLVYFAIVIWAASLRPLWTDELFTYYLSRIDTFGEFWKAIKTGGDQHPPLFYMAEHAFLAAFGESEWALRLPSAVGFWLGSLALFGFVARRTSTQCGSVALLAPSATGLLYYAQEARGYALVFGLVSMAMLLWQLADENRWRRVAVPGLAVCLAIAVGCHYYAVLATPAFGLAEMVRWRRTGEFRKWVWLAFAAPAVTLALSYPAIAGARGFSNRFWAIPNWGSIASLPIDLLGFRGLVAIVFCGLAVSFVLIARRPRVDSTGVKSTGAKVSFREYPEEIVLAWGLMLSPVLAMVLAKFVTGGFHHRYVIFAMGGFVVQAGFLLHRLSRLDRAVVPTVLGVLVAWCLVNGYVTIGEANRQRTEQEQDLAWLGEFPDGGVPIACSNSDTFYRAWKYGDDSLRRRLVYLADPDRSFKYLGHDTVDRCMLTLRPWFGVRAESYDDFTSQVPRFYVVGESNADWQWLVRALIDDGSRLELMAQRRGWTFVYLVDRQPSPPAPRSALPSPPPLPSSPPTVHR